ncbi:phosphopantetheine-binding protein [Streptomyces sp. AC550_RSS872]|uniref:phosphopantetheine-binding protein n=1 Tax=Streptomyces sp. AC550_RSS872 TaxID=2823689 RepID=UPI001C26D96B|nr:phosphopantetheine-binding protein [Streptomyces sp. AC550_RSS872]
MGEKVLLNADMNEPTATESRVAEIWTEVLKHDQFGLDDNFFAIGGHSMFATLVTYQLRDAWGFEIPLSVIFEHSTVRDLASFIDKTTADAADPDTVTG